MRLCSSNRCLFLLIILAAVVLNGCQVSSGYLGVNYKYPPAHGRDDPPPNGEPYDAMFFKNYGVNPFIDTEDDHLSTFAADVDSGSYTLCRQYLRDGNLPASGCGAGGGICQFV
jgi:hypothetical protein